MYDVPAQDKPGFEWERVAYEHLLFAGTESNGKVVLGKTVTRASRSYTDAFGVLVRESLERVSAS